MRISFRYRIDTFIPRRLKSLKSSREDTHMLRPLVPLAFFLLAFCYIPAARAQQPTPTTSAVPSPDAKVDYPDSKAGLEHLAKDIIKAQKTNDAARAEILLVSLTLPHPQEWYERVFGPVIASNEGALYARASASVPAAMARHFMDAESLNPDSMEVRRFDRSCDDNAGESTFGILHARLEPVPLYEIIFPKGDKVMRLASFAYVDGGFRYILPPKLEGSVFPSLPRNLPGNSKTSPVTGQKEQLDRVKVGGKIQAARLIKKVTPEYPGVARREYLQGTVKMHALIGKDGSLVKLYVLSGYCSLAEASIEAVRQWKYSPTSLLGSPVEVDTEIEVIFTLQR
jgi:hypothetical protein